MFRVKVPSDMHQMLLPIIKTPELGPHPGLELRVLQLGFRLGFRV